MILGIDLCRDYAQVSVYNKKDVTVDTLIMLNCDDSYNMPMAICKKKGMDEWYIGDELKRLSLITEGIVVEDLIEKLYEKETLFIDNMSVTPFELLKKYINGLLKLVCGGKKPERICVSSEDYNVRLLDALKEIFAETDIGIQNVEFLNRNETAMYYVLSQKHELWYADVALFDYKESGLVVSLLTTKKGNAGEIIRIEDFDCSSDLPYFKITTDEQKKNVDQMLTQIATKLFDKRVISSVFLTGVGFDYDFQFDDFIKFICNKRRVFAGQNIYSKGACYAAMELNTDGPFEKRMLICKDKLMYELDIDITERGVPSRLRIVKPGTNWYKARRKYDFFVENEYEIVLYKKDWSDTKEEKIVISLEEFPIRPDKATKLGIGFDFTPEGKCLITVKDRGFGNFYKSSGKFVCKEI